MGRMHTRHTFTVPISGAVEVWGAGAADGGEAQPRGGGRNVLTTAPVRLWGGSRTGTSRKVYP